MAIPTKKRITEVAKKLYTAFGNTGWRNNLYREPWFRLARFMLAEPGLPTRRNRKLGVAGPKSCKLVAGKRVCE